MAQTRVKANAKAQNINQIKISIGDAKQKRKRKPRATKAKATLPPPIPPQMGYIPPRPTFSPGDAFVLGRELRDVQMSQRQMLQQSAAREDEARRRLGDDLRNEVRRIGTNQRQVNRAELDEIRQLAQRAGEVALMANEKKVSLTSALPSIKKKDPPEENDALRAELTWSARKPPRGTSGVNPMLSGAAQGIGGGAQADPFSVDFGGGQGGRNLGDLFTGTRSDSDEEKVPEDFDPAESQRWISAKKDYLSASIEDLKNVLMAYGMEFDDSVRRKDYYVRLAKRAWWEANYPGYPFPG